MRIHDNLDEILKSKSKIKILRFLFAEKDEHTGRAIARGIDMSASFAYETLQEMKEENLISARRKGNAILYKLQTDNYIVEKMLAPLFGREKALYGDIVSIIKQNLVRYKKDIVSMAIFGSIIRREETAKSDIDLVIIVKNKIGKSKIEEVIDELNINMAKKFGTIISPYILAEIEIKRKYAEKKEIIISILNNNQLIYGEPIERILA